MDVTELPFNRYIGIAIAEAQEALTLKFDANMGNHLGTVHASAQFALAEACSGHYLVRQFPEMQGKVVALLRNSEVKFSKPAQGDLTGRATMDKAAIDKFITTFHNKSRAVLSVNVEVSDPTQVTMTGTYQWFVQALEI